MLRGRAVSSSQSITLHCLILSPPQLYIYMSRGFVNTPSCTVSALSLLSNPMILIALFSLAVVVGMPYLMENMDPETKAEFEAMQKERGVSSNPAAAVQGFDLAGWMAGAKSGGDESEAVAVEEKAADGGQEGGKGGRRRKNR